MVVVVGGGDSCGGGGRNGMVMRTGGRKLICLPTRFNFHMCVCTDYFKKIKNLQF